MRVRHGWFWFCFLLVEKVARILFLKPITERSKAKSKQTRNYFRHSIENRSNMESFALSLAFVMWFKATRKWPFVVSVSVVACVAGGFVRAGQKSWRRSRERNGAEGVEKPPAGKLGIFE